jgi:hypothetical protein
MTDDIDTVFGDVPQSIAEVTVFHDENCFVIASSVSGYLHWRILVSWLADGGTNLHHNALYEYYNLRFDIAFHEM